MIYLGADHRGFELKNKIKSFLESKKIEYFDCGCLFYDPEDDYPDYAFVVSEAVAHEIKHDDKEIGILICGSGIGMTIAANKVKGIRAALCSNTHNAKMAREHNDANILVLESKISAQLAEHIIRVFLETKFSKAERHNRRIKKISVYENRK